MPRVWNRRRRKGLPADAVYVGRPTKWGNPFVLGRDGTREQVMAKFRTWAYAPEQAQLRAEARKELKGKDLVCWCSPLACHAVVWMGIANDWAGRL